MIDDPKLAKFAASVAQRCMQMISALCAEHATQAGPAPQSDETYSLNRTRIEANVLPVILAHVLTNVVHRGDTYKLLLMPGPCSVEEAMTYLAELGADPGNEQRSVAARKALSAIVQVAPQCEAVLFRITQTN